MIQMNKEMLTVNQRKAVNAVGGSVIVSAAAGAGKTKVLVERVIQMMTNPEQPIYADKMLIVTFTKAAAAEMKQRITEKLESKMQEYKKTHDNESDPVLRRQQILLPNADICTIDSFCSRMVKENFFALNINQDFRIVEDNELLMIKHRIMADIIEEKYQQANQDFMLLSAILSGVNHDRSLEDALLEVYHKSNAHPNPNQWLESSAKLYSPEIPLSKTAFAEEAYHFLDSSVKYIQKMLEPVKEIIHCYDEVFESSSGERKCSYLENFINQLTVLVKKKNWNDISEYILSYEKKTYQPPRGKKKDLISETELQEIKSGFANIDDEITKKLQPVFSVTEEDFQSDNEKIYPAVCCMCDVIKEFSENFEDYKKEKNVFEFSDLEHYTLQLLEKTEFAKSISQKYEMIMIDEFQDTNEIQENIFKKISRDEKNLFVVGDMKQSIYRFREAMPELFKKRRDRSIICDGDDIQYPACIILDDNFRSRKGIIDSVNFVFNAIMSEDVGEIEYNEHEMLRFGAKLRYPQEPSPNVPEMEVHTVRMYQEKDNPNSSDTDQSEEESELKERKNYEIEAEYIAQMIQKMIADDVKVTENGELRSAQYSDFCIIMRYPKKHARDYADTMNRMGIPTYIDKANSLLDCYEVNIVLSLLKVIDNRLQDIPLLAVLLCPVFGFTPDDLAYLKNQYSQNYFYSKIFACSGIEVKKSDSSTESEPPKEEPNLELRKKCQDFINIITELRKLSVTLSISELADAFFEKTGYLSVMSAMPNGDAKLKNIRKLMSFIRNYENGERRNLADFLRNISHLEENGKEISIRDTAPENAVRIMSIHNSKGLEFPICIMAGMNNPGNNVPPTVYCHKTLGFGMTMLERDTMFRYKTFQRNIIEMLKEKEELSEAMRVLYVAMTRAREKLIAIVTVKGDDKEKFIKNLQDIASLVKIQDGKIMSACVEKAKQLGNWILLCAFAHPSCQQLRDTANVSALDTIPTSSKWKYVDGFVKNTDTREEVQEETAVPLDNSLLELLEKRFSEQYQYQSRVDIPAKVSASALAHNQMNGDNIILSQPAFAQEDQMTGAEKGTAMHTFLQYADFSKLNENVEEEKSRLFNDGKITEEQYRCISAEDIRAFTQSKTYQSIIHAEKLYREYRFTVNISAKDVDDSYDANENVILQGAMDCLVYHSDGLIIIDYKTDKVEHISVLKKRYKKQLDLYKNAAEQIFGLPVKQCLIYSTKLGEETEV